MAEFERVRVRDCACPGQPHNGEGDWVLLAPTLSLTGGLAAEQDLLAANQAHPDDADLRTVDLQRRWVETFVRYGARGWNLKDEDGNDVPFSVDGLLDDYAIARPVADRASDLYTDTVLRPFLARLDARSPTGRTTSSTSPRRRRTQGPSELSSPATSAASPQ